MGVSIFFPVSSLDHSSVLSNGQRYRHPFGDKRLARRVHELSCKMISHQSVIINQLSDNRSQKSGFYNILNSRYVELGELINESCRILPEVVEGACLLCFLDTTSVSLTSRKKEIRKDDPTPGVVNDNRTPGFYMHASLVMEEQEGQILGLGDMVIFDRPKNNLPKEERQKVRTERAQLPLEEKESYVWALAASNTQKRLKGAKRVTYVMDQGGDKYDSLARLRKDTEGADFIVRVMENRLAYDHTTGEQMRMNEWLEKQSWQDERHVDIRALDHISKSSGKRVLRQERKAKLKIRYAAVSICEPVKLNAEALQLEGVFYLVEVLEDPSTVPQGEQAIHWRLLTTLPTQNPEQGWHIVECYQRRWNVEQLFRVFKKGGLDIESSQFKDPDAIKRQAILGISTSAHVLQLNIAHKTKASASIKTVFKDESEIGILNKVNKKLSGRTEKSANPHKKDSLLWAVWIIARLGGWNGYEKERPPGPLTFQRGLERFYSIIWAHNLINDV